MKTKSAEIWVRDGKQYVMLSLEAYGRLVEQAEDAGLSRLLKASKKRQRASPTISLDELKSELGIAVRNKRKAS